MSTCRLVVFLVLTLYDTWAQTLENRTSREWAIAGQKVIWETSQVFHRTVIGLSSYKPGEAPARVQSLSKHSARIAGAFGVGGALFAIALAFIPTKKEESPELKFMKSEFSKLTEQIDTISKSIDDTNALIKFETQKAAYIPDENRIHNGYASMLECQKQIEQVVCIDVNECKRKKLEIAERHITAMNVRGNLNNIHKGVTANSALGTSLLLLLKRESECDIPKMNKFVNRVTSLLVKGMFVVIFHDTLTRTDYEYLDDALLSNRMINDLEETRQKFEDSCLEKIDYWLSLDLGNLQEEFTTNSTETNKIVLRKVNEKYPWIHWHVCTFRGKKRAVTGPKDSTRSEFFSSSKKKEMNTFVLVAFEGEVDALYRKGVQWRSILNERTFGSSPNDDVKTMEKKIKKTRELNGEVESFGFLPGNDVILGYYNQAGQMQQFLLNRTELSSMNVHLSSPHAGYAAVVTFRVSNKPQCSESCNKRGQCYFLPYSAVMACRCDDGFQGDNCELSNEDVRHQSVINSLLIKTMKLPTLTSIQHTLDDTQLYLKASLTDIKATMARLSAQIDEKIKILGEFVSDKLEYFNLLDRYQNAIQNLYYFQFLSENEIKHQYFNVSLENLTEATPPTSSDAEDVEYARYLVGPVGIRKWLYQIDFLIRGRNDSQFYAHNPLLFMVMDRHKERLCYPDYKAEVDRTYRQLMLLQLQGFVLWTHAYSILNLNSSEIINKYTPILNKQTEHLMDIACPDIKINHSINFHNCSGGLYVYSSMATPDVICQENHYLKGMIPDIFIFITLYLYIVLLKG